MYRSRGCVCAVNMVSYFKLTPETDLPLSTLKQIASNLYVEDVFMENSNLVYVKSYSSSCILKEKLQEIFSSMNYEVKIENVEKYNDRVKDTTWLCVGVTCDEIPFHLPDVCDIHVDQNDKRFMVILFKKRISMTHCKRMTGSILCVPYEYIKMQVIKKRNFIVYQKAKRTS